MVKVFNLSPDDIILLGHLEKLETVVYRLKFCCVEDAATSTTLTIWILKSKIKFVMKSQRKIFCCTIKKSESVQVQ